jgi:hypothetical protein
VVPAPGLVQSLPELAFALAISPHGLDVDCQNHERARHHHDRHEILERIVGAGIEAGLTT